MQIKIKKGLDIPLKGTPQGVVRPFPTPKYLSLNLSPFEHIRFKLLIAIGDSVRIGQPLVESNHISGQYFVAPAGGKIVEIRRGTKRRLLDIVIEVSEKEDRVIHPPLDPHLAPLEAVRERLMTGGAFPYIRARPFDRLALPHPSPRVIFVSALETSPFEPHAEMHCTGFEKEFQAGLATLARLTTGNVHIVYRKGSSFFSQAQGVNHHTISGPHPSGNPSVHIHHISPIQSYDEVVWTLSAWGVVIVGHLILRGTFPVERILSICGEGISPEHWGYYKGRVGMPFSSFFEGRLSTPLALPIFGNPLMGRKVEEGDFLGFYDHVACALCPEIRREPFHFLRLGLNKFTATATYISHWFPRQVKATTTNQHGEQRAFIDGSIYQKVMPMRIPVMQLVKALLAEDYERAEDLGLLEVAPEDFALPTFICPSKIEMIDIVKKGLHQCALDRGLLEF